jgi:hypothetical protein
MRIGLRLAALGAFALVPAAALAQLWPWYPTLPEAEARLIAMDNGIVSIVDIDATIDGDWEVEGMDAWGHEAELVIDGSTGAVEHAEMDAR